MSTSVKDPNSKSNSGFIWGIVVLLVIIAGVIGYIVWNGQHAKTDHLASRQVQDVAMKISFDESDHSVKLSAADAPKDAKTFDLYEDFSCPHCAELAHATDADMKKAIESGELIVAIHPLNFLDAHGANKEEGHSSKAAAATLAIAKAGDARTYWNLRDVLFAEQQSVANKWKLDDFANAAKELGANATVVNAIKDVDVKALGNENGVANAKKLQELTGEVSSPRLLFEGKDLMDKKESINNWIQKAKTK